MDEPPLFSKKLDDLLPPKGRAPAGTFHRERPSAGASAPADAPAEGPEMSWWLMTLAGGFAVLLITAIRGFVRVLADGPDATDWPEMGVIAGCAFAGGCAFGLLLWGFQWAKWRLSRPRR